MISFAKILLLKFKLLKFVCKSLTIRLLTLVLGLVLYSVQASAQNEELEPKDTMKLEIPKSESAIDSPVSYKAEDSIRMNVAAKKIYLYNKAIVEYGNITLKADYIEVDFNTNKLYAKGVPDTSGIVQGKPEFTSDGKSFTADEMWYDFKSKKGISTMVLTSESEGIIRGDKFLRDSHENVYVRNASYTTCNSPEPHFHIQAGKMKLVQNKQVVSGPAVLKFGNISTPVFIPFGFFPLNTQRKKGLLIGSLSNSGSRGYYLNGFGYYLPINDYIDMQVNTDIYFRGSWGFDLRSNYYRRYRYRGSVRFQYNKNQFGEEESPDFEIQNDYALNWSYRKDAKANPGSSFSASVDFRTKNQSRNNSENIDDIVATNANSNINYSKALFNRKLNFSTNARMVQNLSTGDIQMDLPNFNLNLNRLTPFANIPGSKRKKKVLRNLGFSYTSTFQNTFEFNEDSVFIFERGSEEKKVFNTNLLQEVKNGMRHNIPVSTNFKLADNFNITPAFNYTEYWYIKTKRKTWNNDSGRIDEEFVNGFERANKYNTSLSVSTTIYGMGSYKRGKIAAIRHIVTPTLSASYAPDYSKGSQFGYRDVQSDSDGGVSSYSIFENGIVGSPSGGRQGALSFNLGNNIEMKIRSKRDTSNGGIKKVKVLESLNFSSGYNFLADSLNLSQISVNGNTVLFKRINLNFRGVFDPYQYATNPETGISNAINSFEIENGRLARFVGGGASMSANLNPNAKDKKRQNSRNWLAPQYDAYEVDFNVPWSLRINYSLNYSKTYGGDAISSQSATFSGDIKLTDYWKIGYSSGYNFTAKEMTITKIDMHRDLHCWEFSFGWIPVGTYRRFDFTLKVKASTLSDLKVSRRAFWYDN